MRASRLTVLLVLLILVAGLGAASEKDGFVKAIMVIDDFEDCDVDGWLSGGGPCTALATSLNPGGGVCSMELINACGSSIDGWYRDFASFRADTVLVSLRSQSSTMVDTHFTVGEQGAGGFRTAIHIYAHGIGFWVVAGTDGGTCGAAYTPLQWYDFVFTVDWGAKTYDVSIDGSPCLTGVPFFESTPTTFNRIRVHNTHASAGWYDNIIMSLAPPEPLIFEDDFETGDTAEWSSTVP